MGEGSNPVIDLFQNSVSGMIFQFVEKIPKSDNALGIEYDF